LGQALEKFRTSCNSYSKKFTTSRGIVSLKKYRKILSHRAADLPEPRIAIENVSRSSENLTKPFCSGSNMRIILSTNSSLFALKKALQGILSPFEYFLKAYTIKSVLSVHALRVFNFLACLVEEKS
jgi:hypothetical protein